MKNIQTENLNLHYLPGNKYDTVEELYDGTIKVHPYSKNFFNYLFKEKETLFHFNSLTGCVSEFENPGAAIQVLNYANAVDFIGKTGISILNDDFCFFDSIKKQFEFYNSQFKITRKVEYTGRVDNFTIYKAKFYLYDRYLNQLIIGSLNNDKLIQENTFNLKGIGNKSFFVQHEELWVSDSDENLIYVYNLKDLKLCFQMITPFFDPQALFISVNVVWVLYGGEVNETSYNQRCWTEQKPFFHILKYQVKELNGFNYTLTNRFLVEFTYEEHIKIIKSASFNEISAFISLPLNTIRQQMVEYEILGCTDCKVVNSRLNFILKDISGRSGGYIGYRALMELGSVKYTFHNDFNDIFIPPDFQFPSNRNLMTDHPVMQELARTDKAGHIEKFLELRNRVFRKLFYKTNSKAKDFAEVLQDGYGTCGDYTSIILALAIINNIPVRTAGGFKVPRFVNSQQDNRSCYYNHTWLEVFLPDAGWVPVESSSDDREIYGRLCEGQFLGEDWSHIRTHYDRCVPNLIDVSCKGMDMHPYDIFENSTFMKITGEYAGFGDER